MGNWIANLMERLLDFSGILNASIAASWLILVILGLRLCLKKAPKWLMVALWGLVALRLLMPCSIESPLSLIPSAQTVSLELLQAEPNGSFEPSYLNMVTNPNLGTSVRVELEQSVDAFQWQTVDLTFLWLTGVALMMAYTAGSFYLLRRRLRTAVRLRENIYQCETVQSPFVLGVFRPRIYLPYGPVDPHVIAHEKAHIRRKDHWWKPLGFALLSIHWFNPLMWLAYILLCRDIELACDERVIGELGFDQRADYTQALVAFSVHRRSIAACPLAFGELGVKQRVKTIMNYRKPTFWLMVMALAVCAAVAVCFLTDPKAGPDFPMSGDNLSNLDPGGIVDRIKDFQRIENSDVYMNANNFALTVDGDFDFVDSQAIRYFFYEDGTTQSAQLRIFPNENRCFLTESAQWTDQNRIFMLRHYLDALKYLPQDAVRSMGTADQYRIEQIDGGSPSDYDRVITYSDRGPGAIDGWFIHLRLLPMHANGEGFSGSGTEVIHLFYGDAVVKGAKVWYDYTSQPELLNWNEERGFTIEEFPGVTFVCDPYRITADERVLISGMPIWSACLDDLTGDGLLEICTEISFGSGVIDNRIIVYDYANGREYTLERRMVYDYHLRRGEDGTLWADRKAYMGDKPLYSGRLVICDGALRIQDDPAGSPEIVNIIDPTKDPDFVCDAAMEQFFEDDAHTYYFSGVYSAYVTVEYDDGSQENIISALSAGRAAITDLARFGVSYYAEPKEEQSAPMTMIPTDTKLKGLQAGALLIPRGDQIYRYLLTNPNPDSVTKDELLYTFYEDDMGQQVYHEVYSLKEFPAQDAVYLISAKNGPWLCEYAPPRRCPDSALEDAIDSGYVVLEDGDATHGQEAWKTFWDQTRQGSAASISVAHYATLDRERCDHAYYQVFIQDYPNLVWHHLNFDGEKYTLTVENSGNVTTKTYEYLMAYHTSAGLGTQNWLRYVLTHDDTLTWDQIWNSMISSQAFISIDHYTVYSQKQS